MINLRLGDCRDILPVLESDSIDASVTDPPYELGFMGKRWDASGIAYNVEMWAEVLRVLKPGAYLLAFGGTRTYHRMVCAIEDAGFEIRDSIDWVYGSGFPKSADVSKALDRDACRDDFIERMGRRPTKDEFKAAWKEWRKIIGIYKVTGMTPDRENFGANDRSDGKGMGFRPGDISVTAPATDAAREWSGWGTALKPAHEPIVVARKPLSESTVAANVLRWGTGALNIDASRIQTDWTTDPTRRGWQGGNSREDYVGNVPIGPDYRNGRASFPNGQGRFPANLITDGSAEVVAMFPQTTSGGENGARKRPNSPGWGMNALIITNGRPPDSGSAARFFKSCPLDSDDYPPLFYCAKASKAERDIGLEGMPKQKKHTSSGDDHVINEICPKHHITLCPCGWRSPEVHNFHPCVKPLSLMRYLITLCTREGATVLDPFCGSGSTLVACMQLGRNGIGCDNNAEYIEIAKRRIEAATPVAIELPLKVEA